MNSLQLQQPVTYAVAVGSVQRRKARRSLLMKIGAGVGAEFIVGLAVAAANPLWAVAISGVAVLTGSAVFVASSLILVGQELDERKAKPTS